MNFGAPVTKNSFTRVKSKIRLNVIYNNIKYKNAVGRRPLFSGGLGKIAPFPPLNWPKPNLTLPRWLPTLHLQGRMRAMHFSKMISPFKTTQHHNLEDNNRNFHGH